MAYQILQRKNGVFREERAVDELNVAIQGLDEYIDGWKNKSLDYRYKDVKKIYIDGASDDKSFSFGHKIVLSFSLPLKENFIGALKLKCAELRKLTTPFCINGSLYDSSYSVCLLYNDGVFRIPVICPKTGIYHFYAVVIY